MDSDLAFLPNTDDPGRLSHQWPSYLIPVLTILEDSLLLLLSYLILTILEDPLLLPLSYLILTILEDSLLLLLSYLILTILEDSLISGLPT